MMKIKQIIGITILLISGCFTQTFAQQIKGIVFDLETSQRINEVQIKNLRTNKQTVTDNQGNFTIDGQKNDYLTLTVTGYDRDTAFIYQEGISRIFLIRDKSNILIDEVVVSKITDSRINKEIERAKNNSKSVETSQFKGGLRISPSRLFGKSAKQARNAIKILELERDNRKVDRVFTTDLILSLIPLNNQELPLFKDKFRPSYKFIEGANKEDLVAYILDSYAQFKSMK